VPLAISWPGHIAANSTCDVPIHGVDFFETFRELLDADAPKNQPLDGVDILPLMTGQVASLDRALYWHFPAYLEGKNYPGAPDPFFRARPFSIIREGNWKLVETFEDQQVQLFDLANDLGETQDVSQNYPEITQRLADQLKAWRADVNAPVPTLQNPGFKSQ
ncbi:MAG: aryl-sulfate sulfohydrolase, partial [Pirellulaceae bacterium]|nr:aryl-sulfate sulfohydrolase [Pirellulaceae bacterium]